MSLVIDQPYQDYTAQDHAIWRYVMRQNVKYLGKVAHSAYLDGLARTGISLDHIPHMYGMNRILKDIGWAAVAVDGFIPPSAFMEFQACHVLVIAADIRPADQIEYTPAPDIIHEAAGHAPIIADEEYSQYLVRFGELGAKAFSSSKDVELYEAIRHLSILKADPYSTREDISAALSSLESVENSMGAPSEMSLIRNLHWWTVEYGLVGELRHPKIYGAGLLSSIGESRSALSPGVKKLPYSLEAMHTGFDITTRQPQLFVTPDFNHLNDVLEEFAQTMSLYHGGLKAINKAVASGAVATCVFSSGLQVSGIFSEVLQADNIPVYLKTVGATTLSYQNELIHGHGAEHHPQGYGSPVGKISGMTSPLEYFSDHELETCGILQGRKTKLTFETGLTVEGVLEYTVRKGPLILLLSFTDCTVLYQGQALFLPHWGRYDMAAGAEIISAFAGPAFPGPFGLQYPVSKEKTHKIRHSGQQLALYTIFQQVDDVRNFKLPVEMLPMLWEKAKHFGNEWLLPLEILEILGDSGVYETVHKDIKRHLSSIKTSNKALGKLISNGLNHNDSAKKSSLKLRRYNLP